MYLPKHFEVTDPAAIHAVVRACPLAIWATVVDGQPVVNHVPFMLDATRGEHGTLIGHVARANPVWRSPGPSVLIFQGPDAYVSPSWYPAKREHGKVVPTWNYAVVHVHGTLRFYDNAPELHGLVSQLTATHESTQAKPWKVDDAPADFVAANLRAIIGFELAIERIEGKWKVSQNRNEADALGAAAALEAGGQGDSAALIRRFRP